MSTRGRAHAVRRRLRLTAGMLALAACVATGSLPARAEVITQELFALTLSQELSTYMLFQHEEAIRYLEELGVAPAGGYDPKAVINEEFVREIELAVQRAAEMGLLDPDRANGVVALVLESHQEHDLVGALQEQMSLPSVRREAPVEKYRQVRKGQAPPVEVLR